MTGLLILVSALFSGASWSKLASLLIQAFALLADPLFSEIPASTLNEIKDGIVFDNFFVDTPLQRYFRAEGSLDPFYGGAAMQVPFQFARLSGGAIAPGQDVVVTRKQILDAALFIPKLYTAFVALEEFQLKVLNTGPEAKVDLYELYIETLTKGLNTDVEIDWYFHGQALATGVAANRSLNMNGMAEALNDGVTNSWNGDSNIEMRGIRFEEAIIFNDLLTPSAVSAGLLPTGLSQTSPLTPGSSVSGAPAAFTSAGTPAAISKLPATTSITVGELLLWLHIPSWKYRPAADPDFLFGVRGPIPSPTNPTLDTLFMNLALNSYTPVPRNSIQCYGLGS